MSWSASASIRRRASLDATGLSGDSKPWTRDRRLRSAAERLGVAPLDLRDAAVRIGVVSVERDPHADPVPESALEADRAARLRGRVEILNATRPGGMDGWTMDLGQYELLREFILERVTEDGVLLKDLVAAAQDRFAGHELFPGGRLRNYVTYTKVDLEARGDIERLPRSSPQRIVRRRTG